MQFAIIAFAALAAASPALRERIPIDICPALDSPLCCELGVDGIIDLTCETPKGNPSTTEGFKAACSDIGYTAQCCTLPLDGDALLCSDV